MVDATTQAALEGTILNWRMLIYADVDGDVLRATSGLYNKTVVGSGDSELDGVYESYDHNLIEVSAVRHNETGSDTVAVTLGGLLINLAYIQERDESLIYDRFGALVQQRINDFLNIIGDRTRWQGRAARLWFYCVDENENQVGSIIPYYTGYMNDVTITGSPETQKVTLTIENYLATLAGAQNKTYLMQSMFDPGDLSANASIAAANGIGMGSGYTGGGGAGGGSFDFTDRGRVNLV